MNIPQTIFGAAMIGIGILFIKLYISSRRNGVKDTFGSEIRMLVGGIGLIGIGIIIIVKSF